MLPKKEPGSPCTALLPNPREGGWGNTWANEPLQAVVSILDHLQRGEEAPLTSLIEKTWRLRKFAVYLPATKDRKFPAEAAQLQEHLLKCTTHKAISSPSGTSNAAKFMVGSSQCHPKDPKERIFWELSSHVPTQQKLKKWKRGPQRLLLVECLSGGIWGDL